MKFPTFYRHGVRNQRLMRFNCVMFACMVGREDPILYATVIQEYIEKGKLPGSGSYEKFNYVDKVL